VQDIDPVPEQPPDIHRSGFTFCIRWSRRDGSTSADGLDDSEGFSLAVFLPVDRAVPPRASITVACVVPPRSTAMNPRLSMKVV
jgi:hypothetical protein